MILIKIKVIIKKTEPINICGNYMKFLTHVYSNR
jgi:hypothetical protein